MAILGQDIGKSLLEVLGLSGRHVRSIVLNVAVDEVVTATVEFRPTEEEGDAVVAVLEEYILVPKERFPEDIPPSQDIPH